ncbi:AfsR/SARP family transcriptional regulator [Dactylosporangium sp. McL0621]|uniref:AfsR/SARP family transcriptional regulator n=1 Tax=Dactylosporangium sp. McL0621 TaxID=3415678 RepID=UPI003CFA15FA
MTEYNRAALEQADEDAGSRCQDRHERRQRDEAENPGHHQGPAQSVRESEERTRPADQDHEQGACRSPREDRAMDLGAGLRVTLLGEFQASRRGTVLPVPGGRLRGLLVRLALAGGRPVEPGVLVEAIWAGEPPSGPASALQTLASRLRRALTPDGAAPGVLLQVVGGYRLAVDAADVDALRFERLATAGRERLRAGDPAAAAAALAEAVTLWGERPGAEPAVIAAVAPTVATRLAQVSVEAVADLAAAELALGRAEAAVVRLTGLVAEQPVHERAAALLMDALAAAGRQAEALAVYERVRASWPTSSAPTRALPCGNAICGCCAPVRPPRRRTPRPGARPPSGPRRGCRRH